MTVAGDSVLVCQPGLLVSIGAICAYPTGFLFYLTIGLGNGQFDGQEINFHARTAEERAAASRLEVRFADGQVADSLSGMTKSLAPGRAVLRFAGGGSKIGSGHTRRGESRWWVSPLPTPGPLEFTLFLHGATEPSGTREIDARKLISAASRSQTVWPEPLADE